ncbi:hypothetical protein ACFL18_01290 [Patescibacteria group bacterium]
MSLTFDSLPTSVNEDDEFVVNVSLIDAPDNRVYYLRAALFEAGKTNYFGYTYNHLGQWHNVPSEATKFLEITTNNEGSFSGQLRAKADLDSSYFKGEGEYQFKVGRYTTSGNFGSWSDNIGALQINYSPPPSPEPSPEPAPESSPTPVSVASPVASPKKTLVYSSIGPTGSLPVGKEATDEGELLSTESGEVLGESEASEAGKKKNPYLLSIILIILGLGLLGGAGVAFKKSGGYNQEYDKKRKV